MRLTYVEIPASDRKRSAAFYESVLGWSIDVRPDGDPRFSVGDAGLIGRFTDNPPTRDAGVLVYFTVDNVADSVARAEASGGTVVAPPRLEGDTLIARLRDPAGNLVGIWQFAEPDR